MKYLLLLALTAAQAVHGADVITPDRRMAWEKGVNVGVKGGIPTTWTNSNTAAANTLWASVSVTRAEIQAAINAAENFSVIRIPAGTWTMDGSVLLENSFTILRGQTNAAGWPTTILNFGSSGNQDGLIETDNGFSFPPNNWSLIRATNISSGVVTGSVSVVLAGLPGDIAVEGLLVIDQLDVAPFIGQGSQGHVYARPGRFFSQTVIVTNISGNTIGFEPPLIGKWWDQTKTPQAYTLSSVCRNDVGVEDLEISRTPQSDGTFGNFSFANGYNKWVKNVKSTSSRLSHVWMYYSVFCEVRDSYFTLYDLNQSSTYCIRPTHATGILIENNIITNVAAAISGDPSLGCVMAYNYIVYFPWNSFPGNMPEILFNHGGHSTMNLWEGNWTSGKFIFDSYHGNASYYTFSRNRIVGWDSAATNGATNPFDYDGGGVAATNLHSYNNIVGNILGLTNYHTSYSDGIQYAIFDASYFDSTGPITNVLIKGNYNTVSAAIPAGEALGSDTIANSYFRPSKPAWFGVLNWPPYSPTAGLEVPSSALLIPAGYRYAFGAWPSSNPRTTRGGLVTSGGKVSR